MGTRRLHLTITFLLCLVAIGRSQVVLRPVGPPQDFPYSVPEDKSPPGPKCDYFLQTPVVLISGTQSLMCTFVHSAVPVKINVHLEIFNVKISIIDGVNTTGYYYKCHYVTVPIVTKLDTVYITISLAGSGVDKNDRRPLAIDVKRTACLCQNDKPLYQQRDTIKARLVCYDDNLKPVNKTFTNVDFVDPNGARIYQMKNLMGEQGVLELTFGISENAQTGYYSIQAMDDQGNIQYCGAQVQQFNLPRFTSKLSCPGTLSVLQRIAVVNGSALYSFGKPVSGTAIIKCCRPTNKYGRQANCYKGTEDICFNYIKELDSNGNFKETLDLRKFQMLNSAYESSLSCDITVKENGTDILDSQSCYMWITDRPANILLNYDKIGMYYNKGKVPFSASLQDENGRPLANKNITITIEGTYIKDVMTDGNGKAECQLDTSKYFTVNITISASYEDPNQCYGQTSYSDRGYPYVEIVLGRYFSRSGSYVHIRSPKKPLSCGERIRLIVDYKFTKQGVGKNATKTTVVYTIMSKNTLAASGSIPIDLSKGYEGSVLIDVHADDKTATGANVVVMSPMVKDMISDVTYVSVEPCFKNVVELKFGEAVVQPGAIINRTVTAAAGSLCGLRIKDGRFDALYSYEPFNPNSIYSSILRYFSGYQYQGLNFEQSKPPCKDPNSIQFCNEEYVIPVSFYADGDAYQDFTGVNLMMATNLQIRRQEVCGMERNDVNFPIGPVAMFAKAEASDARIGGSSAGSIVTYRSYFDTGFGFTFLRTGPDGKATDSTVSPQSITNWNGDAFCMSSTEGLGMTTKPAEMVTFQIFYTDVAMPKTMKLGERVNIVILANNYMDKCAQVKSGIKSSGYFNITYTTDNTEEKFAESQKTASWSVNLTPSAIGKTYIEVFTETTSISSTCGGPNDDSEPSRRDTVKIDLTIMPGGIERTATFIHYFQGKDSPETKMVNLTTPNNYIAGSLTITLSVVGNPVALFTQNLDNLLTQSAVCCDDKASLMLSIMYVSRYMESQGLMTADQRARMRTTLSQLYMDQMACRSYYGGYSQYRSTDISSFWTTLLSFKALNLMSEEGVFVDSKAQTQTINYLSTLQDLTTGCFNVKVDFPIYQINDTSNYIAAAAAISYLNGIAGDYSGIGSILEGAKKCINDVDYTKLDTLTQCYMADALLTAGEQDKFMAIYKVLVQKAITQNGGGMYWEDKNQLTYSIYTYLPRSSGSVSITACMVKAITKHPNPSPEMITIAAGAAIWLSGQVTLPGRLYSAQAKERVLDALTSFANRSSSAEGESSIVVRRADRDNAEVFRSVVNSGNEFQLQSKALEGVFANYEITSTGNHPSLFQLAVAFSTTIDKGSDSAFSITTALKTPDCFGGVAVKLNLHMNISYRGPKDEGGKSVLMVYPLTGYNVDQSALQELVNKKTIADFKMATEGYALIYLEKVPKTPITLVVTMYMENRVEVMQPVSVVIYDTFTEESGTAKYHYECNIEPAKSEATAE